VALVPAKPNAHGEAVVVREMRSEEARTFLEIHRAAVRDIAARDYPSFVIETWAPPITEERLNRFLVNRDGEIRLLAFIGAEPVGIGAIVVAGAELRACYVSPSATRRGVGTALVSRIERIAREHGLDHLELESSVTAEPFYAALGYEIVNRGEYLLAPRVRMAATKMRKTLE
jgi:putative acetyltransferase